MPNPLCSGRTCFTSSGDSDLVVTPRVNAVQAVSRASPQDSFADDSPGYRDLDKSGTMVEPAVISAFHQQVLTSERELVAWMQDNVMVQLSSIDLKLDKLTRRDCSQYSYASKLTKISDDEEVEAKDLERSAVNWLSESHDGPALGRNNSASSTGIMPVSTMYSAPDVNGQEPVGRRTSAHAHPILNVKPRSRGQDIRMRRRTSVAGHMINGMAAGVSAGVIGGIASLARWRDSSSEHGQNSLRNSTGSASENACMNASVSAGHEATGSRDSRHDRDDSMRSSRVTGVAIASELPWSDADTEARMNKIRATVQTRSSEGARAKLWRLTESPYSSKTAYLYAVLNNTVVLIGIFIAFLQTIPLDSSTSVGGLGWGVVQTIFEIMFGLELLIRFICCPHRSSFLLGFCNLVDLVATLPLVFRFFMCATVGCRSDTVVKSREETLIALVVMLRLLKLLRRFEKLQLLVSAFHLALEALPVLLYTLILIAIFFSELIFIVEPRDNINDLPTAVWFTIVTMTTVGYGDYIPRTAEGHTIASVLIIISAMYMAIPIGIVGNAFNQVWGDRDRLLAMQRFRDAFLEGGFTLEGFQDIFNLFDEDGSGELDVEEFSTMLRTMQMNMDEERVYMLYQTLDKEGQGRITLEALIDGLMPKAFAADLLKSGASIMPGTLLRSGTNKVDEVEVNGADNAMQARHNSEFDASKSGSASDEASLAHQES